jgi:hypothetical protein
VTSDVIALCHRQPDQDAVLAALLATGPELGLRAHPSGAVMQLLDSDGRPLLAVEGPIHVQVPGEVERLLGPGLGSGDAPVWWVEIRAVSGRDGAVEAARRFASRLVGELGGTVWPR